MAKIKLNAIDQTFYYIFCILSLGLVWIFRLVISEAIRVAFKVEEE